MSEFKLGDRVEVVSYDGSSSAKRFPVIGRKGVVVNFPARFIGVQMKSTQVDPLGMEYYLLEEAELRVVE